MASAKQLIVVDRQLAGVNVKEAQRKWREKLPVSLKQMAVALELGYTTVRQYSRMPGFPMLKGFVHPNHFDNWLEQCFQAQSSGATAAADAELTMQIAHGVQLVSDKSSVTTLPMQAKRLLEAAGIRK